MCQIESELNKTLKSLISYQRNTFIPITEIGDGSIYQSKFSGVPFLKEGEEWTTCEFCNQPLRFFLQVNIEELPHSLQKDLSLSEGLLQMFICTNETEACACLLDEPNSYTFIRYILKSDLSKPKNTISVPSFLYKFPAKTIVSWKETIDYPSSFEIDYLENELSEEEEREYKEHFPLSGDKMGGYADWIQGEQEAFCNTCYSQMRFILQIDSECNLPYTFGCSGRAYVLQCPNHPNEFYFWWDSH